jgi:hypothetical protein
VTGAGLGQQVRDVGVDRARGQEQPLGDLGVRQALRDQPEHLGLARP